jgi:hypothetical protein
MDPLTKNILERLSIARYTKVSKGELTIREGCFASTNTYFNKMLGVNVQCFTKTLKSSMDTSAVETLYYVENYPKFESSLKRLVENIIVQTYDSLTEKLSTFFSDFSEMIDGSDYFDRVLIANVAHTYMCDNYLYNVTPAVTDTFKRLSYQNISYMSSMHTRYWMLIGRLFFIFYTGILTIENSVQFEQFLSSMILLTGQAVNSNLEYQTSSMFSASVENFPKGLSARQPVKSPTPDEVLTDGIKTNRSILLEALTTMYQNKIREQSLEDFAYDYQVPEIKASIKYCMQFLERIVAIITPP